LANLGPAALAAGGAGFPTGNQNALALGRLATAALIDGFSFTEFYAGIVTDVGTESRSALTNLDAQQSILDAAIGLRESFSGVNMDEEAVRLMEFEATFQALVRVVQVVDSLTTEILSIVR
jgi:flagellar hook-associated protein 1 FlgK